ncbi:MAG: phosphoribosylglycinamide formyltransferase [Gammaproteobacteria bacterium]|nr:MAG: phosphoribosylglycinamide formyltransferase [Gammaproteobacteria bacterium]
MTATKIVVLISGNGSNLQSIIDAIECGRLNADITAVISNNPDAYGLSRAKNHGIHARVIDHRQFTTREAFDQELLLCTQSFDPDYIVLAGFMRILGSSFIQANKNKILNIHPSLLPFYKGLNTYQRAIDNGETEHGVSIHIVTAELDDGPVLMQGRYPIEETDVPADLTRKGQGLEYQMYPELLQMLSEKRLEISERSILYDQQLIQQPIEFKIDQARPDKNS